MVKTIYYTEPTDDVVQSAHQDFQLQDDFRWLRTKPAERCWSWMIRGGAKAFAYLYTYGWRRAKIVGQAKLQPYQNQGYFVYGNHTQPVNDVFMPFLIGQAQHFYALAAPANWGIPIIGLLLSYGGALPVGNSLHQTAQLLKAVQTVSRHQGHVFIYPEAHVWPNYTEIRPFPDTSFRFPIKNQRPAFAMTTTYQKPSWGKKPRLTVFIDGPFIPDHNLSLKKQQSWLHDQIQAAMLSRARLSNYEAIKYIQERR